MPKDSFHRNTIVMTILAAVFALVATTSFILSLRSFIQKRKGDKVAATPVQVQKLPKYEPAKVKSQTVKIDIIPKITNSRGKVLAESSKIFAYAHGTVVADDQIFIGMSSFGSNPFTTNKILIFSEFNTINPFIVTLPMPGDIASMVYDVINDKVYVNLSSNGGLHIFSLNPKTYQTTVVASSSAIDLGHRPAIVTDGVYIYGITDMKPSTVFKIRLSDGTLTINNKGHIPKGHSAAIGIYNDKTELYFGGGSMNGFEKVNATTLDVIKTIKIEPCRMSDDMPFIKTATSSGYVYIGCEESLSGIRVKTNDLSYKRFSLPGASLGLFVFGSDIYNAARDGRIDIFPDGNLRDLHRYEVMQGTTTMLVDGQRPEINEIMFLPKTNKLYFTAWWGVRGLYEVSIKDPQNL